MNFAYHVTLGVGTLSLCFGVMLLLAGITIGWRIYRAALMNPVTSLRSEYSRNILRLLCKNSGQTKFNIEVGVAQRFGIMKKLVMAGPVVHENAFDSRGHNPTGPRPKLEIDSRFVNHLLQTLRRRLNFDAKQGSIGTFGGFIAKAKRHQWVHEYIRRGAIGLCR